jgi:deoxyribonuclease (pyrimidine dimer)
MTRINAAIKPAELSNAMLFAEYREIKRVANKVKQNKYNLNNPIPKVFSLNKNHEVFFRDKILYLSKRSEELYKECLKRGINAQDYSESYKDIPQEFFNDWQETKEARELLKERINLRLTESKQVHRYYDRVVSLQEILIK